jgi:RecA-family ATPase
MTQAAVNAQRFLDLFKPAQHAHGTYSVNILDGAKHRGKADTHAGPPTFTMVERHLAGVQRVGFVPIHRDGTCRFAAIDIDDYKLDHTALATKIERHRLPLVVCRSKSGGAHLYWFLTPARPATEVRAQLADWAALLGFSGVEIFPKQDRLEPDATGNWINAPYHGEECWAVNAHGQSLTLDEFLVAAANASRAQPVVEHESSVEAAADALLPFWQDNARNHISFAIHGALLRHGFEPDLGDSIVSRLQAIGGGRNVTTGAAVLRQINRGNKVYGLAALRKLTSAEATAAFMKATGLQSTEPQGLPFELTPILSEWLDAPPPPQLFTVEPWLPHKVAALLVAEGGAGKTTLAMRIAMSVATGRPLFDRPTRQGRAVYIAHEDHSDSMRRRVWWLYQQEQRRMREAGASPDELAAFAASVRENLIVHSAAGYELHLVALRDGQAVQGTYLDALLEALPRPLELLVLDPMSRLHGAEENHNGVGTTLLNAAERIAREVGCTVLVAHHTGKAAARDRDTSMYAARGASGFADAARSVLRLIVANADDAREFGNVPPEVVAAGDLVRVVHAKCNDGPRHPDLWLRRQAFDFEHFEPRRVEAALQMRVLLDALHGWWYRAGQKPFSRTWLDDEDARREAFRPHDVSRPKARSVIAKALETGDLVKAGDKAERSAHQLITFRGDYAPVM